MKKKKMTTTSKKEEEGEKKEEEEEEEEHEENEEQKQEEEEDQEQQQQQQLEEGLYEIEEIKKKRIRKGQLQYLIKWRGWPESANTWEPYDSLHSTCADVIEAFEEEISSKSSRKRKRKSGGSPLAAATSSAAAKKKKPSEPTDTSPPPPPPPPPPPVDNDDIGVLGEGGEEKEGNNSNDENADDARDATETKKMDDAAKDASEPPPVEANGPVQEAAAAGSISVQLNGVGEPGGSGGSQEEENPSKAAEVGSQAPVLLGAKKRKAGNVRRFKQEPAPNQEEADSTEEDNSKRGPPLITKIIMPVEYCATVTDNVQQVSITFRALRSDGREVLVDNKHLKATNPELLFSYYEQHLRYTART